MNVVCFYVSLTYLFCTPHFLSCDVQGNKQQSQTLTHLYSSKPLKASASHPEQEQSFSCFSFLLKPKVTLLLLKAAQGFAIPVIIPQLLNSAACRETKAGLTVDV